MPTASRLTTYHLPVATIYAGDLDITNGNLELNNQGGILNVGAPGNDWTATALTLSGGSGDNTITSETTGSGDSGQLDLKTPASSTGLSRIRFFQGSGDGSANNMRYNLGYNASTGYFSLISFDTDGASADGDIFRVVDGTPDLLMIGNIILQITDTDAGTEGSLWYDASEDKLKFKTAAGVETITSA